MNGTEGASGLLRAAVRRDRLRLGVLVLVLGVLPATTRSSYARLHPEQTQREALAEAARSNPTLLTLYGHVGDLMTADGFTAWRTGTFLAVVTAIVAAFTAVRHTRAEEDAGRAKLLAATAVGRSAPTAAAAIASAGAGCAVGLLSAATFLAAGADPGGSAVFGLAVTGVGAVGAGVGLLTAQVFSSSRAARATAAAGLGAAYLVRGVGDAAPAHGWLSWLSPVGWFGQAEPFAGNHWPVLTLPVLTTLALVRVALRLRLHRDLGSGLLPHRPGRPRGARSLVSIPALAWRLGRGAVIGWCVGLGLAGLALGNLTSSVPDLLRDNPGADEVLRSFGGAESLTAAFLGTLTTTFALAASAAGVQAAAHAHAEESTGHLEVLLAAGGRRAGWYGGHLLAGLVGSAGALLCGVAATRLTAGSSAPPWSDVLATVPGQLPAVWTVTAAGFALVGALPRFSGLAWAAPGFCLLVWFTGPLLDLGRWWSDLSPFSHLPAAPGTGPSGTATVALSVLAAALVVCGAAVTLRRDLRGTP